MTDDLVVTAAEIEELAEKLSATAAYVLLYLWAKAQERKQDRVIASYAKLGAILCIGRGAIGRALEKLSEQGFVALTHEHRRITIHIHRIPEINSEMQQERTNPEPIPNQSRADSGTIVIQAPVKEKPLNFQKPEGAQVTKYASSIGYRLDGQEFCDFYESKGWMIGKNHMKDWKAAVRTWKKGASPASLIPKRPEPVQPEPLPDMSPEEMVRIRQENMKKVQEPVGELPKEATIPVSDINDLVVKLAGGARRIPK
jgi:hypothetical protein